MRADYSDPPIFSGFTTFADKPVYCIYITYPRKFPITIPIGSMYGIYANIWGILMVNVTIYSIHGSYGI